MTDNFILSENFPPFAIINLSNSFLGTESLPVAAKINPFNGWSSSSPSSSSSSSSSFSSSSFSSLLTFFELFFWFPLISFLIQSSSTTTIPFSSASKHFLVPTVELSNKKRIK